MRLALLADVHANLEALVAVLAHAERERADGLAFLGDLVGYGADPAAVLARVQAEVARGAVAVLGNHDAAVLDAGVAAGMNGHAAEVIAWTRERLGAGERAFLASLPLTARRAAPGLRGAGGGEAGATHAALLVHASAEAPGEWVYVTDPLRAERCLDAAAGAAWIFAGHVHEPVLYYATSAGRPAAFHPVPGVAIPVPPRRRWLGIAGSVGQPRDGRPAASYALFDEARRTLTYHRVAYDWPTAAAKVRAAGLPARLAERLERGE